MKTSGKVLFIILWLAMAWSSVPAQAPPGPSSPLYGARPESGPPATGLPSALQEVRIEQKLDQQLPLDLTFRDEAGNNVKLGQYFGQKPVVLAFVYYDCIYVVAPPLFGPSITGITSVPGITLGLRPLSSSTMAIIPNSVAAPAMRIMRMMAAPYLPVDGS